MLPKKIVLFFSPSVSTQCCGGKVEIEQKRKNKEKLMDMLNSVVTTGGSGWGTGWRVKGGRGWQWGVNDDKKYISTCKLF